MRIAFDAKRIVANGTGLGSYGRTLINALAVERPTDQFLLYAPDQGRDDLRCQIIERPNVSLVYPSRKPFPFYKSYWRSKGIVKQLQHDGIDVFHGLSGELPIGLKAAGIRGIVTIHDLIFLRHPAFYHWIDTKIYARKFHQTLREADRIIAISECTKRDILYYGDFPADRIDVIYQSCGTRFAEKASETFKQKVKEKYQLPERFLLFVGTIEVRKNALLAVKALRQLPDDLSLVLVGRPTDYVKTLLSYIKQNGLQHRVCFLHGVPNEDLPSVYQQAEAFVYPSRYEGFGIPIIEAIQSGLPVVAATGSCLEEAGGPDCLYVHPDDAEGMAKAVLSAIKERKERVERSREYIRRFENQNVAQQVLKEYSRL